MSTGANTKLQFKMDTKQDEKFDEETIKAKQIFFCEACDFKAPTERKFKQHTDKISCQRRRKAKADLESHLVPVRKDTKQNGKHVERTIKSNPKFYCEVCDFRAPTEYKLNVHKDNISCQRKHKEKAELKGHMEPVLNDQCKNSQVGFKKKMRHNSVWTEIQKEQFAEPQLLFKCSGCCEKFTSAKALTFHRDFDCPHGKLLSQRAKEYVNRSREQKINKSKKKKERRKPAKLICDTCGHKSSHPTRLIYHQRFVCNSNISEGRIDQDNTNLDGDYMCVLCKKIFRRKDVLDRHRRSVDCMLKRIKAGENLTVEKPFQCKNCLVTFTRRERLKSHVSKGKCEKRTHIEKPKNVGLKNRTYKCDKCGYIFNYLQHLNRHKSTPRCALNQLMEQQVLRFLSPNIKDTSAPVTISNPIRLKFPCMWCDANFNSRNETLVHMHSMHEKEITKDLLAPDKIFEHYDSVKYCCYICLQSYSKLHGVYDCISLCERRIGLSMVGFVCPSLR